MCKLESCSSGQPFSGALAVRECSVRQAGNGTDYLALRLTDGETEIMGRVWDHSGEIPAANSVVFVSAMLGEYRGQLQLT